MINKLFEELMMNKIISKYKKEIIKYLKEKYPEEFI